MHDAHKLSRMAIGTASMACWPLTCRAREDGLQGLGRAMSRLPRSQALEDGLHVGDVAEAAVDP